MLLKFEISYLQSNVYTVKESMKIDVLVLCVCAYVFFNMCVHCMYMCHYLFMCVYVYKCLYMWHKSVNKNKEYTGNFLNFQRTLLNFESYLRFFCAFFFKDYNK